MKNEGKKDFFSMTFLEGLAKITDPRIFFSFFRMTKWHL